MSEHADGHALTGAPVFKARGRMPAPHLTSSSRERARQTDSAAYTVGLLDELLAEQRRTNDLLDYQAQLLQWLGGVIQHATDRT